MNAKKIKDTLQRLSGEYENLIKSINRSRLAAKEIKLENTGGDINEKRLEAGPRATMCIRCLEETEAEAAAFSSFMRITTSGSGRPGKFLNRQAPTTSPGLAS